MTKILSLFLISFSLSYAQFSDSLKTFNYEDSFIKTGFQYPADISPGFIFDDLDNCKQIGSVTWEVVDSSYMEPSGYFYPLQFISIDVYISDSLKNDIPYKDVNYKNKGKLDYNEWEGFIYDRDINYITNKDTLRQKGHTYLLQRRFGQVNVIIIGDERNATGALDAMKKICETFYYEEKAPDILPQNKYKDIKEVDFYNLKYPDVKVKDSLYYIETSSRSYSSYIYAITGVVFGDLTGVGKDEAAVSTYEHTSGTTGHFTGGYVYTLQNSRPVIMYEIPGGDRAANGIERIEIKDGLLEVTRVTGLGGLCCPEYEYTTSFKWQDTTFIPVNCTMYSFLRQVKGRTIEFSSDTNEITLSDTTDSEIYYSLNVESGDSICIETAALDKKKTALHLVFCSDTGLVIGGCDNYAVDELHLNITKNGTYYLRIVPDAWAWKAYIQTRIKKFTGGRSIQN